MRSKFAFRRFESSSSPGISSRLSSAGTGERSTRSTVCEPGLAEQEPEEVRVHRPHVIGIDPERVRERVQRRRVHGLDRRRGRPGRTFSAASRTTSITCCGERCSITWIITRPPRLAVVEARSGTRPRGPTSACRPRDRAPSRRGVGSTSMPSASTSRSRSSSRNSPRPKPMSSTGIAPDEARREVAVALGDVVADAPEVRVERIGARTTGRRPAPGTRADDLVERGRASAAAAPVPPRARSCRSSSCWRTRVSYASASMFVARAISAIVRATRCDWSCACSSTPWIWRPTPFAIARCSAEPAGDATVGADDVAPVLEVLELVDRLLELGEQERRRRRRDRRSAARSARRAAASRPGGYSPSARRRSTRSRSVASSRSRSGGLWSDEDADCSSATPPNVPWRPPEPDRSGQTVRPNAQGRTARSTAKLKPPSAGADAPACASPNAKTRPLRASTK